MNREEAIKIVKSHYPANKQMLNEALEYLIPELKEVTDELTWLKNYISGEVYYLSMDIRDNEDRVKLQKLQKSLAWLEKQGEQKPTDKIQLGKEYKCIASPRYSTFRLDKIYKPEDKFLCRFMNLCSDCFEPIEDSERNDLASNTNKVEPKFKVGDIVQYITDSTDRRKIEEVDTLCNMYHTDSSPIMFEIEDEWKVVVNAEDVEQNPTDKIEPKFKVGDWITDGNITIQIEAIKNDCYLYCGDCALYSTKTADKVYHLWTIEDAKPGDIIYAESKFNTFEFIGIFYTLENGIFWDYCDVSIDIYNDYLEDWEFDSDKGFVALDRYNFYPATKIQRHLLYQKMKDAGYEWDTKKKELKDL